MIQIISLPLDDFRSLIADILEEKLKSFSSLPYSAANPETEFLTTQETLQFLHVSKPTLMKLRKASLIKTVHSTDKRVLFCKSDLIKYLQTKTAA